MSIIEAKLAGSKLHRLIEDLSATHEPVMIRGKRSNAVLIPEDDWRAIQETLYLLSIPGMRKSVRNGLKTPVAKCLKTLRW
jgi:antitoxin YefM